jgi:putative addiction module CopG family antidote
MVPMAMTSLNISLPGALKDCIESQVATGLYSAPSEYVRALVRDAQETRREQTKARRWAGGVGAAAVTRRVP